MDRRYYSKRHFQRLANGGPSTSEQAAWNRKRRAAGEQANQEMMERFAPLTPEKALEAVAWQDRRIAELMGQT